MNEALKQKELDLEVEQQKQACVQAIKMADNIISKQYLGELAQYSVAQIDPVLAKISTSVISKFFLIESISYSKEEKNIEKLSNVYNILMDSDASLVSVIISDGEKCEYYLGVRDLSGLDNCDSTQVNNECEALYHAFLGNFPGSRLKLIDSSSAILERAFQNEYHIENCVASVSGIASLKSDGQTGFIQGIENLMDSMRGQRFSVIFISDAVKKERLYNVRSGYENMYTTLSPFSTTDINISYNENESFGENITKGFTKGLTESLSQSQGLSSGLSIGSSSGINQKRNIVSSTFVNFFGGNTGANISQNITQNINQTQQETKQKARQETENDSSSHTTSNSIGYSKAMQTHLENKTVSNLLSKIDERLKQIKLCEDLGAWECAAYFIAEDSVTAMSAANAYRALMRGKKSSLEPSYINVWTDDCGESCKKITTYLKRLTHPRFVLPLKKEAGEKTELNEILVFPGSLISGNELPIQIGLPQRPLQGLPVMEFAAFGRDIITYKDSNMGERIRLGKVYHMGACSDANVDIQLNSLTMHTFVTGSTGSGKSNTIYNILNRLRKEKIKFLVIEPAKGEYKNVFGGYEDVNVFGTNINVTQLLTINPFQFPSNIQVLSHIEKLMEIFNACWSMYAAMSSFLKQALIKSYEQKGWDMEESINYSGSGYPSFHELLEALTELVEKSAFSQEVKSNYTGALVERVKDLTVGVSNTLFSGKDIGEDILFGQNCIIDISQDLSTETKSLVMGFLIIRMDEYLNSKKSTKVNLPLRHVTVLEEAHNLLRKTSFAQSQENTNMQGKSVEMISNAIAQLRSMGEGFIIVDQAPKELDESVIRNTNTKIIHRIPFEEDYRIVGKSVNISETQLIEIPRLKDGVAVVFQNNWLQPVLCQFPLYDKYMLLQYQKPISIKQQKRIHLGAIVQLLLAEKCGLSFEGIRDYTTEYIESIIEYIRKEKLNYSNEIIKVLREYSLDKKMSLWQENSIIGEIITSFFEITSLLEKISVAETMSEMVDKLLSEVRKTLELNGNRMVERTVGQYLLATLSEKDKKYMPVVSAYIEYVQVLENNKRRGKE